MFAPLALAALLTGSISVQTSVTTWLVFDPHSSNRLTIQEPASFGGPTGTRLVGGVRATLTFDLTQLLLNRPVIASVRIDEIRVAGDSFAVIPANPALQTGTICVIADPAQPGTGTLALPVPGSPVIDADMRTLTFLTSSLGAFFPNGIALSAHIHQPLQVDLRAALANRFRAGPIAADTNAQGVIPPGLALLGGQPFTIHAKILNSLAPPQDPLLDQCAAFLATRS